MEKIIRNIFKHNFTGDYIKTIKIIFAIMLCLSMFFGMSTVTSAAGTHMLSKVNVGDIFTTGDIIQNDNNIILLAYYGQTVDSFGGDGRDILTGNDSFPMGQNSAIISPYWKVSKIGENGFQQGIPSLYMILTPVSEKPGENGISEAVVMSVSKVCNHHYEWMIAYDATAVNDGQKMNVCKYCGHAESTVVISAYSKFLEETVDSILTAPAGSVVDVDTKLWLSFSEDVAVALQKNPNVTVNVKFVFDRYRFQITIPAGYDLMSKMNNGFAGFAYLATDPDLNLKWIP